MQAQHDLTVSSVQGHHPDGMNLAWRTTRGARTVAAPAPGVLRPVGCQQGVSNRPLRAHARPCGEAPDGPTDLVRRDVSGGAIRSCVDRKSTRLNSSHVAIAYAVFCL